MMDVVRVSQILQRFSGLSKEALADAMPIVAVTCAECAGHLRKPEYAENPLVLEAAAALCNYRLVLRSAEFREGTTTFSAGDLKTSISHAAMLEAAVQLRDDSYSLASAYFTDTDFLFVQV